jgi:hypothetical protein
MIEFRQCFEWNWFVATSAHTHYSLTYLLTHVFTNQDQNKKTQRVQQKGS